MIPFWIRLLRRTQRLQSHIAEVRILHEFYSRGQTRFNGTYQDTRRQISEFRNLEKSKSARALDLDLFGPSSLMGQIDETFSLEGYEELADELTQNQHSAQARIERQQMVRVLSSLLGVGRKILRKTLAGEVPLSFTATLQSSLRPFFVKRDQIFFLILSGLFVLNICLFARWLITGDAVVLTYTLTAYLSLMLLAVQLLGRTYDRSEDLLRQMERLVPLFGLIETQAHQPLFRSLLPKTLVEKPGRLLKKLERQLQFLSIESNPFVFFLVNALLPWHHFFSRRAESVRSQLVANLPEIFDEIKELEIILSFTCMARYQGCVPPSFVDRPAFKATGLFHPLLLRRSRVGYSFDFSDPRLGLITGSNMSGKSTFLRSLGLNFLLAQVGAPVFAAELEVFPGTLLSCIRVSDSIQDGYSYFYAEVKRVSEILQVSRQNSKEGRLSFYLLDELFKGTNHTERVKGASGALLALLETNSLGFVTSHDRELNDIFKANPRTRLLHFSERVEDLALTFDYQLKDGPSETTNALIIMKQQGIPVSY